MIDYLKNIYNRFFSKRAKKVITPKIRKSLKIIYVNYLKFTGKQYNKDRIGCVNRIPFTSKLHRKISFAQQGEDLVLDRILTRKLRLPREYRGIYVDIGAYHPVQHSVTSSLYLPGWHGLAVDASSVTQKLFNRIRPRDKFVQCVVGGESKSEVNFYIKEGEDGDLSLINTKYPDDKTKYTEVVTKQININEILSAESVSFVDFMNIDIEGAELEVLTTLDFDTYSPKVICVEIHEVDIVTALETDVARYLFSKGYVCVGSTVISFFFTKPV